VAETFSIALCKNASADIAQIQVFLQGEEMDP
jgi:hypothetical protein